jgi:phenylacetate-CoA ligase
MNPRIVRAMLWPLHERLRGRETPRLWRALRAGERLPREAIAQLQLAALRETLTHAVAAVPYYRRRFAEHRVEPASFAALADLERLPFLTKADIRTHLPEMLDPEAEARGQLAPYATSGSTGEPLSFYVDRRRAAADNAARARARLWWGVWPGDREVLVWGSRLELGRRTPAHRVTERLFNLRTLPAGELGDGAIDALATAIRRFRPTIIFGYATAVGLLAEYVLKSGSTANLRPPRVVITTAEVLLPTHRRAIAKAFGCGVATEYGSRECGVLAGECPRGRLHVAAENALLEIVEPDGDAVRPPGEAGEIVVTLLRPYGMPMVRYRTGDIGRLSPDPCGCGLGLPVLASVEGRRRDVLRLAGGRLVHPSVFSRALAEAPTVARYRVLQKDPARIVIQVAEDSVQKTRESGPTPPSPAARGGVNALEHALASIRAELGDAVRIEVERVSPDVFSRLDAAGKFRWVISEVEDDPAPHAG